MAAHATGADSEQPLKNIYSTDSNDANAINSTFEQNLRRVPEFADVFEAVCAADGAAVTVAHNLTVVPSFVHIEGYQAGDVWRDVNDRRLTNERTVTFHCEKAGRYTVTVGKR